MAAHPERITRTPGVCGGKACIAGHRIRVIDIVRWHEHRGMTPDEIISDYPTITLSDVHSALAYYFDHVAEIEAEFREERAAVEAAKVGHVSKLAAKLSGARLEEAS